LSYTLEVPELLGRYGAARAALVECHLPWIRTRAKALWRPHPGMTWDDFNQALIADVLELVDGYEQHRGSLFNHLGRRLFGVAHEIRGDHALMTRSGHTVKRERRAFAERARFEGEHGRTPSAAELAGEIGWTPRRVARLRGGDGVIYGLEPDALDAVAPAVAEPHAHDAAWLSDLPGSSELGSRERWLLDRLYRQGYSMADPADVAWLAKHLGMTEGALGDLHTALLVGLRHFAEQASRR
jgi:hypothetical protein